MVYIIIERFESRYFWRIILFNFIPFIMYMGLSLYYVEYYAALPPVEGYDWEFSDECIIRVCLLLLMIHQLYFEVRNIIRDKFYYLLDFFNIIDLSGMFLLLSAMLRAINGTDQEDEDQQDTTQTTICVVAVVLIWFKCFQWLNLFRKTSFYVGLVVATFSSIKYFLLLMILILLTFGNAMTIQSLGRENPLYSNYFD